MVNDQIGSDDAYFGEKIHVDEGDAFGTESPSDARGPRGDEKNLALERRPVSTRRWACVHEEGNDCRVREGRSVDSLVSLSPLCEERRGLRSTTEERTSGMRGTWAMARAYMYPTGVSSIEIGGVLQYERGMYCNSARAGHL